MWRAICVAVGGLVALFWNVENYFDPFDDPFKNDDEFTPAAVRHWTWSRFEAKRDGIAQVIVAAGDVTGELPALVGLAEVENRLVVSQLVQKTMLAELGYGFVHRESPDERGIDVALLYRRDLLRVEVVDSLRVPGFATRDILYVRMRSPVKPGMTPEDGAPNTVMPGLTGHLHVFVAHLPSKRGGARSSDARREAALGVLGHAVDSLLTDDPTACIVVMGDFNDTEPVVPGLRLPPFADARGDTPLSPNRRPPGTLRYHGRWEQIDWFFVSPALEDRAAMDIFAPPFLLEEDTAWLDNKPRRTYVGPRYHGGLSDHLPVILQFFH